MGQTSEHQQGSTSRPSARATRPAATKKRRRSKGWVPDQHGAWFMVTVPALTGLYLSPSWIALAVLATWWSGYFLFFAASLWARTRFRTKNRPPVVVYAAMTAIFGVATLIADWTLLRWVPAFLPLIAIAVYETWKRRPRSLASGVSTVIAACLMTPVLASAATSGTDYAGAASDATSLSSAWIAFGVYATFFIGTVPYVKTLIRNRGQQSWLVGSAIYHLIVVIAAIAATATGLTHWLTIIVAAVLLGRAVAMPYTGQRRDRPWTPKTVGLIEAVITVFVVITALL